MTTEVEFREAFTHLFTYCFDSINAHLSEQLKTKQTPFSVYMKEKHEKLKEEMPDISKRSTEIARLWKDESDKVKVDYKEKAENYVPDKKKNKKRAGGLNNFQLFCKFERDAFVPKKKGDKKQSTRSLSLVWKDFGVDKKLEYKNAAVKYNKDHGSYSNLAKEFGPKKNSQKKNSKKSKGSKKV